MTDVDSKKLRSRVCSVPGCGINKKLRPEIGFFALPNDPPRAQYWLEKICVKQTDRPVFVCGEHFEESLINRTNPLKRRLNGDAVPTLKLPTRLETNSSTTNKQTCNDNLTAATEQPEKIVESLPLQKRKNSKDFAQQPKKKIKGPSVADKAAVITTLQSPKSTLSKCSKPLKFYEYVHKEGSNSKAKEQLETLAELTGKQNINTTLQSQEVVVIDEETRQQIQEPVTRTNYSIQKIQTAPPQVQMDATSRTFLGNTEKLKGMIQGANDFTLKLHEIQKRLKDLSQSPIPYKRLCLKLYMMFPNEYKTLQSALGTLPVSDLKYVFQDLTISIDLNSLFGTYLSYKATAMTMKQTQCFLYIEESKIKSHYYYDIKKDKLLGIHNVDDVLKPKPATTALVITAKGIFNDWQQPVAVGYLENNSPSIKPWIDKIIKNLFAIGFTVRAIVFANESEHFIKNAYTINKKKIYCFHDFSFLLNSFYYDLMRLGYCYSLGPDYNIYYKGKHIVDFYELDRKKQNPLTPKITHKLLNPTNLQELNIKSVMEVFSTNTAAAISAYMNFNVLDESANTIVVLITKISKLYEILNTGSCLNDKTKGFAREKSQIDFLLYLLKLFTYLEPITPSTDGSHNTSENFKILINSVLALSENLKSENYDYLPIWRFSNHDAEAFFDKVQKHSKSITKPVARDVDIIFKQIAVIHLLKNHNKTFKPIQMDAIAEFQKICKAYKVINPRLSGREPELIYSMVHSSEYNTLNVKKDGIIFLAGFLLKKCTSMHEDCGTLKMYNNRTASDVETLSVCENIMDDVRKNICILPSATFIELVESMEITFRFFINKEIINAKNGNIILSLIPILTFQLSVLPCPCFPTKYLKYLYLRFRIYRTLKFNNELNKTKLHTRLIASKL